MERKIKSERVSKIEVSKIKSYFSESSECVSSDDFVMTPIMKFSSMADEVRVIEGVTMGVVCNGTAKVVINDRSYELRPNSLFLLREESKISKVRCTKACTGYFVTYSSSFVNSINLDTSDMLSADMLFSLKPCFEAQSDEVANLYDIASAARAIAGRGKMLYGDKVTSLLLTSFFYAVASIINNNVAAAKGDAKPSSGDELMRRFIAELSVSCEVERSVEYYAKQLGITPKYLSLICKKRVGKNASKVIDGAVINKAKELLTQSGLSVQEVAERLNFVSQSFFGKYFKQRTGVSPSRYKVQS